MFSFVDMEIVSLMKDGMIEDWEMFEKLAEYTYKNRLHAVAEHHPILMTECPWNTRFKREKLLELMFEKFNVPAMYICKNAVLAAYANGRSTAMVVDSGATHTSAVPVHDGYVITQGIVKSPLGGDFVTMQCKQFLEDKEIDLTPACLIASKGECTILHLKQCMQTCFKYCQSIEKILLQYSLKRCSNVEKLRQCFTSILLKILN